MSKQRFESVWDAVEDTPHEAASMKVRSALTIGLQEHLKKSGMTQIQAAQKLAITQPRASDLMRGKIELFSLEALVDMISAAGLQVEFKVRKKSSDSS